MSFKPWQFLFNPPPTVPTPVPTDAVRSVDVVGQESRAVRLMTQLDEMLATSEYLQQVMLARSKGIGITIDPRTDTDIARALEVLYGETPPTVVTVDMYNHLLDAEMTALQVEMALPPGSPYEVNAFQTAAASQVTKFVENQFVETGEFRYQVPLLLRNLKGDAVIFSATKQELAKYPAARARTPQDEAYADQPIKARTLDISEPLSTYLNQYLDDFAGAYASMYQLAATVGHVEQDFETIVNAYITQPVEDIIRMVSLFQALKGMIHVPKLKDIVNGLTGVIFVRLQAEVTSLRMFTDRFMTMAVDPLKSMTGTVGRALSTLQGITKTAERLSSSMGSLKDSFSHQTGALQGMSFSYDCGLPHNASTPKPLKGMAGLDKAGNAVNQAYAGLTQAQQAPGRALQAQASQALTSVAAHLKWGMDTSNDRSSLVDEAFKKMAASRLGSHEQQADLMCSTQVLDSMISLGKAMVSSAKGKLNSFEDTDSGALVGGAAKPAAAVERILASTGSSTGTQFVMQDGQLQAVPPNVPPIPAAVELVLARGGLVSEKREYLRTINGVFA